MHLDCKAPSPLCVSAGCREHACRGVRRYVYVCDRNRVAFSFSICDLVELNVRRFKGLDKDNIIAISKTVNVTDQWV